MSPAASVFTLAAVLLSASLASAQAPAEGAPCSYELCAVRYTSGFSGEHLLRGASSERALKIGFTGANAVDFLSRVESAAAPARSFRTRRVRAGLFGAVSALALGYFYGAVVGRAEGGGTESPTTGEFAVLIGGFGTAIVSGIEANRSRNDLSRAIWEFNRAPVR